MYPPSPSPPQSLALHVCCVAPLRARPLLCLSLQPEIAAAVAELQALRKKLDELSATTEGGGMEKWSVNKKALDDTVTRRMFVVPSFEIHGGVAGLYDYGPPGCAVKENILALWRQHFVLEDNLLQIECTTLTPYPVLKASGHVDKFEDLMVRASPIALHCIALHSVPALCSHLCVCGYVHVCVNGTVQVKDNTTGECFRADKLLEDVIDAMLTKDKEMTSTRREELRKMAAQAGAFKYVLHRGQPLAAAPLLHYAVSRTAITHTRTRAAGRMSWSASLRSSRLCHPRRATR